MEAVAAASHLDAVHRDEHLGDVGQEQSTEHFEIPLVGRHEVEAVVRVRLAPIENGLDERLEIGNHQLRALKKTRLDPVDRAVPATRVVLSDVTEANLRSVLVEVRTEPGVTGEVDEAAVIPRVDEVRARPVGRARGCVPKRSTYK